MLRPALPLLFVWTAAAAGAEPVSPRGAGAATATVTLTDGEARASGVFVSRDGLILTTRAAVRGCLAARASTLDADAGFVARSPDDELRCPTLAVLAADGAEAIADVRLVFVPERTLMGSPDTALAFPRYVLDVVLVRAWAGDNPRRGARFVPFSARGPLDGMALTTTQPTTHDARRITPAQLEVERDVLVPFALRALRTREAAETALLGSSAGSEERVEALRRDVVETEALAQELRDPVRQADARRRHDKLVLALHALPDARLSSADKDAALRAFVAIEAAWRDAAKAVPRIDAAWTDLAPSLTLGASAPDASSTSMAKDTVSRDAPGDAWDRLAAVLAAEGPKLDAALAALEPMEGPLSKGVVRGSTLNGKRVSWATGFGAAYAADRRAGAGFLPERWRGAIGRVDFSMPLTFTLEFTPPLPAAGAPLWTDDGLLTGIVIGRTRAAVADERLVPRGDGRTVAVASNAVLHALDRVYDAKHIVDELLSSAADR